MSAARLRHIGLVAGVISACAAPPASIPTSLTLPPATHSGPLAISLDGTRLYVAHPDTDEVTVVDTTSGTIQMTIPLTTAPPAVDTDGHYYPAVQPRALMLDPLGQTLYVTGQRSGHVYAFDASTGAVIADAAACAEPIGIVLDQGGANVFVACAQDDAIVELRATDLSRVASVAAPHKPWALAWSPDGTTLLSTHLLGWGDAAAMHPPNLGLSSPGLTAFTPSPLALKGTWSLVDGPTGTMPTVPHGQVRGVYDAAARPGTNEVWALHVMLGTDTAQPDLDFENTVFPAVSILSDTGASLARLTVSTSPGDGNAIGDIVSGMRALAFSPDGRYAFIVDAASEDVLIIDATQRVEVALVRPLPGHQPEGVVWGLGAKLFVQERDTEDVAVIDVTEPALLDGGPEAGASTDAGALSASVEANIIGKLPTDPMPAHLRLGQHLFHSANSDEYPITSNHWASCTTCHLEGRSDAVTWKFLEGPRDTPSNAGGLLQTGFLFRTADRSSVTDYWQTIDSEQGGDFRAIPAQIPLLGR